MGLYFCVESVYHVETKKVVAIATITKFFYILCPPVVLTHNISGSSKEGCSMEYSELSVFRDISNDEVESMIHCFRMRRAWFESGETVCTYGESGGEVGVLIR